MFCHLPVRFSLPCNKALHHASRYPLPITLYAEHLLHHLYCRASSSLGGAGGAVRPTAVAPTAADVAASRRIVAAALQGSFSGLAAWMEVCRSACSWNRTGQCDKYNIIIIMMMKIVTMAETGQTALRFRPGLACLHLYQDGQDQW